MQACFGAQLPLDRMSAAQSSALPPRRQASAGSHGGGHRMLGGRVQNP